MKFLHNIKIVVIGSLFFSSIVGFSKENCLDPIEYNIKYLEAPQSNCLEILTKIKENKTGEYLLKLPKYAGNISFTAKKGKINYTQLDKQKILIQMEPNVNLEASYKVCIANQYRNNYYPIIEDGFFHFIAEPLLILPVSDEEDATIIAKFQFENFPKNYSIVSSYGLNERKYEVKSTLRRLNATIIAGGLFDVETKWLKGKPIHIVLNGKWKMVTETELKDAIYKIVSAHRDFLKDDDFPNLVLIIYDGGTNNNIGGVSGLFYENTMTMVVVDSEEKNKLTLYGVLSHELFHAWMGGKIRIPLPQGNLQWFFEGVNDFYGWQLALDAGIISEKEYLTYYNKILMAYELSPHKTSSNELLSKNFTLRSVENQISMHRGHIMFMEILSKLKGKGRAPIDAAMREIAQKYANDKDYITQSDLDVIFKKHLGNKIWNEASKVLYAGKEIQLSKKQFSNKMLLKKVPFSVPHFGFDLESLAKEKVIVSLEKNSPAVSAGLKENDKVLNAALDTESTTAPAQIRLQGAEEKVIQFMPEKREKKLPQYVSR